MPAEPAFTIEKHQRLEGESRATRSLKLTRKVGQTVEYEIIVKNTGNVTLKFGPLSDAHCEDISPSGAVNLAVGGEESYTCDHVLSNVGIYYNEAEASHEGKPNGTGKPSNKVEVERLRPNPRFTIEKLAEDRRRKRLTPGRNWPAKSGRQSNTRSSSRTPATWR